MRGECLARLGQVGAALENLNTLLLTRWNNAVPYVPVAETDAAVVVDRFLEERRKSLVYRGLRWMDIKRLNKENRQIILHRLIAGRSYTLEPNAPYYALPLPIDIIETAGIPQN